MKRFYCDACDTLVMLDNDLCTVCQNRLVFVPETLEMRAWGRGAESELEQRALGSADYRRCRNDLEHHICNWVLPADTSDELCLSCSLTKVIPDLALAGNLARWHRLEAAKRRMLVNLLGLGLLDRDEIRHGQPGLAFQFMGDPVGDPAAGPVLTGHDNGLITINVAEADDPERERRRVEMHEPYRTLVGHLRHEIGHYYWDRLIGSSRRLKPFRKCFGDERADYASALQKHYDEGPVADWQTRHVSAYASAHPWEDWAETWAHYLHMVDSLETACESGLRLNPRRPGDPNFIPMRPFSARRTGPFRRMIERWMSLTHVLNDLNRGLGLRDAYPFVLSDVAIEKLEFVHDTVAAKRKTPEPRAPAGSFLAANPA